MPRRKKILRIALTESQTWEILRALNHAKLRMQELAQKEPQNRAALAFESVDYHELNERLIKEAVQNWPDFAKGHRK
jgi:hypothetical protein